jgi:cyclopropane-fatty-acyl-phospholipid synthase
MPRALDRALTLLEQRYRPGAGAPSFAIRLPDGQHRQLGPGDPAFTIVAPGEEGVAALATLDSLAVAEGYVRGALEVEGDFESVIRLRTGLGDRHPLRFLWRFVQPLLFGRLRSDRRWIASHYGRDSEMFLLFLDGRHRCYSQGIYERDDEPLEDAITRKLDFAMDAVGAKEGDRVLDIGAGWGAFTEHAGKRGVQVTGLTIARESEEFVNDLIAREGLPCRVLNQHLLEHAPDEKYDAIVNLGVSEHLPDYRGTLRKYLDLLKPGGSLYLDFSAVRVKHSQPAFTARHVYPGSGSLVSLHELLAEVARTPFQLRGVYDDRHSYHLTAKAWAENLDRNREEIETRWGRELYRVFRIYLWATADSFRIDNSQAYRVVLHLPDRG